MVMFIVFGVLFGLLRVALVGRDKITLKKDAALGVFAGLDFPSLPSPS